MATNRDSTETTGLVLDGRSLTVDDLVTFARFSGRVHLSSEALLDVDLAHDRLVDARESGTVYGANTGVGANRGIHVGDEIQDPADGVPADDASRPDPRPDAAIREAEAAAGSDDTASHGRRLLRSHASGAGRLVDEGTARAMMVVRLNQFLAGGSGISRGVVDALAQAINRGAVPALHRMGSIGTGDLTATAELALNLLGEQPWLVEVDGLGPTDFEVSDSLPFMSSGALTLTTAALATAHTAAMLDAATVTTALSFLALDGSGEAYDERITAARPHAGQARATARLRYLTRPISTDGSLTHYPRGRRLQDPFGLRIAPQVQAPAENSLDRVRQVVELSVNSAAENPLITADGARHHGQFHEASLATALDAARLAVHPVFALSVGRVAALINPALSGQRQFLAGGAATSSGLMILEYVVQDALATMRVATTPVSNASVNVSLGLEEHASFSPQSARLLADLAEQASTVLAVELVAAVRALRSAPGRLAGTRSEVLFEHAARVLPASIEDRPLSGDVEIAVRLLPELVELAAFPD